MFCNPYIQLVAAGWIFKYWQYFAFYHLKNNAISIKSKKNKLKTKVCSQKGCSQAEFIQIF